MFDYVHVGRIMEFTSRIDKVDDMKHSGKTFQNRFIQISSRNLLFGSDVKDQSPTDPMYYLLGRIRY